MARLRTPFAALAILVGACGSTADTRAPAPSPPPEGDTHYRVDFASAKQPTGRLVGWNLGRGTLYAPADDALHPEWRTPERVAAAARLALIRAGTTDAPWVRFSGLQIDGSLGQDGYHFWDFARPDRVAKTTDNMGAHEYMTLVSELGGEPLVMLNFGSGSAKEAAEYATHLDGQSATDPLVTSRAHWGHPGAYDVSHFELGNEVYGFWNTGYLPDGTYSYANPKAKGGGDPDWLAKPSSDAASYAARALAYVAAVRAVVPDARFWVPLSQASMDAWGGVEQAISALSPLLESPAIEAVVIHHYLVDDAVTLGLKDPGSPAFLLGGSELFRPLFSALRTRLASVKRGAPLDVAVTEYHVAGAFSHGMWTHGDQAIVGPSVADMILLYADLGIEHAAQHLTLSFDEGSGASFLVERWYDPFRADGNGDVREMPSYRATRLVAGALRALTIPLIAAKGATLALPETALAGFSYPAIHATAFVDHAGLSASIALVNREIDASHTVTFDLGEGYSLTSARHLAPSGWDADATIEDIALTPAAAELSAGRLSVVAPKLSVTVVELTRIAGAK